MHAASPALFGRELSSFGAKLLLGEGSRRRGRLERLCLQARRHDGIALRIVARVTDSKPECTCVVLGNQEARD